MDVVFLSRLQFALTIMFHYLFPPLTIGMGVVLVYLQGMHLRTKEAIYKVAARFWTQLYAITFAVGVATGIVMEFQFGTNWAVYSRFVGDVFGSALAAEGIFAFFLESGFLAVLVFGWDKVSPRFHFFATVMVALGSMFSAVWIVVANSWQQTPTGHHIVQMTRDGEPWVVDGKPVLRAEIVDFGALVFNPSTLDRLTHTLIGAFIMGAFFIMSISAYYLLKRRHEEFARRSFTGGLLFATVFSLLQLVSGHSNAKMVADEQPAKLAAFEGLFTTEPAGLSLFGIPDAEEQRVQGNVQVPRLLSFLVHGDLDTPVTGLDRIPREDWPPLVTSFASYHVMIALGVFFIVLTVYASILRFRGTLFRKRWLLWVFVASVLGPVVANQAGWIAAEVGRQPWVVQPRYERGEGGALLLGDDGLVRYERLPAELGTSADGRPLIAGLRTRDAVSETVTSAEVLGSMISFGSIYLLLGVLWVLVLDRKIRTGPQAVPEPGHPPHAFLETASERVAHEATLSEGEAHT